MKVIKKTNGSIIIKGINFKKGEEVEVNQITFNYLKKTFPNVFDFVEDVKKEPEKPKTKIKRGRKYVE